MNSLCLNFFIVHYLLDKHMVPAEWALAMYLGTAVWVAWVGLARVYMGLHTPIDIGAGALLGTLVLVFYLAVDGNYTVTIFSRHLRGLAQHCTICMHAWLLAVQSQLCHRQHLLGDDQLTCNTCCCSTCGYEASVSLAMFCGPS